MTQLDGCLELRDGSDDLMTTPGELLALANSLHAGTLTKVQREAAQALHAGIPALVEQYANRI
jgi:hypothetical protein